MSRAHGPQRRTLLFCLAAVGLVPLSGCTTKPLRPVNADGTYGHRIGKSYRPKFTCTATASPTDAVEADAKRFEAGPASLSVYGLRRRRADASMVVPVKVDGADGMANIPDSLARLRLKPGAHCLSAQRAGRTVDISVQGRAGDLRVVELIGSGWT